jgi:hypothetical protein
MPIGVGQTGWPGAKFLIILEGINDITHPAGNSLPEQAVTPDQIIGRSD